MNAKIINNNPDILNDKTIKEEINTIEMTYMDGYINILEVTATAQEKDKIFYQLLIEDTSGEPIPRSKKEYIDQIIDIKNYAKDHNIKKIDAQIEIISTEKKLSQLSKLTLTLNK